MEDNKIVTTVAAVGEVESDYNLANFSVGLTETADTVPDAKRLLKEKVDALQVALSRIVTDHQVNIIKNSTKTSINVAPQYEYNHKTSKQVFKGYLATYGLSFQTDTMDKVSAVYDELTSLEEVSVNNPSYDLKNRDKLNKKALAKAWDKVTARFNDECSVLGLNAADYVVATWEVTYSDSHRGYGRAARRASLSYAAVATVGASNDGEPIELISGQAVVNVNLTVGYRRRD